MQSLGGHNKRVVCVAFSPDGKWVAAGDIFGDLYLADRTAGYRLQSTQQLDGIEALAFAPGSEWLATVNRGGAIQLYPLLASRGQVSLTSGPSLSWMAHDGRAISIAISPDAKRLFSGGRDGRLQVWEPDLEAAEWSISTLPLRDFATGGSDQLFVFGNGIHHWDLDRRRLVDFSPNGRTIATAEAHGVIQLWHADTGQPLGAVTTESTFNGKVRFCGDGQMLANRLADDQVIIYDATENKPRSR